MCVCVCVCVGGGGGGGGGGEWECLSLSSMSYKCGMNKDCSLKLVPTNTREALQAARKIHPTETFQSPWNLLSGTTISANEISGRYLCYVETILPKMWIACVISIMLRSCQGGAVDHQCHRRRVRGSPRVDIYISPYSCAVKDISWRTLENLSHNRSPS